MLFRLHGGEVSCLLDRGHLLVADARLGLTEVPVSWPVRETFWALMGCPGGTHGAITKHQVEHVLQRRAGASPHHAVSVP